MTMLDHQPIHYKGHILLCEPRKTADGRFSAQAAVGSDGGFNGSFSELGTFDDEAAAVLHAETWVKSWIDHNMGEDE